MAESAAKLAECAYHTSAAAGLKDNQSMMSRGNLRTEVYVSQFLSSKVDVAGAKRNCFAPFSYMSQYANIVLDATRSTMFAYRDKNGSSYMSQYANIVLLVLLIVFFKNGSGHIHTHCRKS